MNLFQEQLNHAKEIKLTKRADGYYSVSFETDIYSSDKEQIDTTVNITFHKVKLNLNNMEVMFDEEKNCGTMMKVIKHEIE